MPHKLNTASTLTPHPPSSPHANFPIPGRHEEESARALFHGEVQRVRWRDRASLLLHVFAHADAEDTACCGSHKSPAFQPTNPSAGGIAHPLRPIILVGHGIHCDIRSLNESGFDFTQVPIVAVIDTQELARELYRPGDSPWNVPQRHMRGLLGVHTRN
jgi:hypothetical protein